MASRDSGGVPQGQMTRKRLGPILLHENRRQARHDTGRCTVLTWKMLSGCASSSGGRSSPSARLIHIDRRTNTTASHATSVLAAGRSMSSPWNRSWDQ